LLASLGGVAGLGLSIWSLDLLKGILPRQIPVPDAAVDILLRSCRIDGPVFAFTLGLCAMCAIGFGLVPAFQGAKSDLTESLKEGGRGGAGSVRGRTRDALIVIEIALALILLSGVGLMFQTLLHLEAVKLGFSKDHELTMQIELPTDSKYQQSAEQARFFRRALEEVKQVPGVQSAGVVECLPLDQEMTSREFRIEGRPLAPPGQEDRAEYRRVSENYFETLGIPLSRGRRFTERDDERAPLVAIVDQTLARQYWPNENPVGQRLFLADGQSTSREIVGVVGGVKHFGLSQACNPMIYVPFQQQPAFRMTLVVRTTPAPASLDRPVKEAIWRVDQDQPVYRVRTMDQLFSQALAVPRMTLDLFGGFAFLALVLAAVGIYGVMAYSVAQRTNEIGIRMALGAPKSAVLGLVLWQTVRLALLGVVAGVAGAFALTRLLSGLLYGVKPTDPLSLIAAGCALVAVAMAAAWVPARRAAKVDPMTALRAE
jgi:putative ABC transport system permease protein